MSFSDRRPLKANFIGKFDLKSVSMQLSHEGITLENELLLSMLRNVIFIMIFHLNQNIMQYYIPLKLMLH
jgi:hypothetical protein